MPYETIFTDSGSDVIVEFDPRDAGNPIAINDDWITKDEAKELVAAICERLPEARPSAPRGTTDADEAARVFAGDIPLNEALLRLAALNDRTVEFRYAKGKGATIETRRLEPSKVMNVGDHATFVGHDPDRDDVRAYRVDRIVGTAVIS